MTRIDRLNGKAAAVGAVLLLCISAAAPSGCSQSVRVGEEIPSDGGNVFVVPEADAAVTGEENDLRSYCPSNRCPPGHTTCPTSQFLCDVDLLTDLNNCGECGNKCPSKNSMCADGRCVLSCNSATELDCDGVPDNGCEAKPLSNDNCGYCGNKCPADKPCIDRGLLTSDFQCGCKPGELYCGGLFGNPDLGECLEPSHDDKNCGACGNACPPEGDGTREAQPNTYFGCFESACGKLKCKSGWGDCDLNPNNGCETNLSNNDDNCGTCGNRCLDGMTCDLMALGIAGAIPACMCPKGTTFCGATVTQGGVEVQRMGNCRDLTSDPDHCGACGAPCPRDAPHAIAACVHGSCDWSCNSGWGDCNGSRDDGCETNLSSDPKNCGGCGVVCDGIAGQACVNGQCMVEPCDELRDAGGPPR